MRAQHRASRAGQHRPAHGEYGGSRQSRRGSAPRRRWGTLVPVAAFLAAGAIAAVSAVGFGSDTKQADASTPRTTDGVTTPVSDGNLVAPVANATPGTGESAPPKNDPPKSGVTETKYGPLTAADRDFMDKVRQAGAWEGPTGRQAQERAGSQKVKDVGLQLVADHAQLDQKVIAVAQLLGHELPEGPSTQQQGWMDELGKAEGEEYDKLFADRLRAAHGKVFAVVADIRAGTKNGMIRQLAQTTNAAVLKHMTILEGTGMVNFSELPDAKNPGTAVQPGSGTKVPPDPAAGNNGSNANNDNANPPGTNQFGQPFTDEQTQNFQPAASPSRADRDGGLDNSIIVIFIAIAGVISAVAYRQLHHRRKA